MSDYHFQLAVGHYRAREVPQALRELLAALEQNPDNADALYLLGFIYQGRGDFEMAETYYRQAIEIRPDAYDIQNNLGTVYLEQERWDEAAVIFRELTRAPTYLTPEHALNNLGWAQYNLGLYREALDNFELAVEFQPEHCLAWNNQGLAWERLDNLPDARRAYDAAVRRCDDYPEPRYNLAMIALNVDGDTETARTLLQECVDAQPESNLGRRCLEYLEALGPVP